MLTDLVADGHVTQSWFVEIVEIDFLYFQAFGSTLELFITFTTHTGSRIVRPWKKPWYHHHHTYLVLSRVGQEDRNPHQDLSSIYVAVLSADRQTH